MSEAFRTLRGFLAGEEPDEETRFAFSATLRIFGDIPDLTDITIGLEVDPTYTHHKGDRRGPKGPGFPHDMWAYKSPLSETEPLERHIEVVWAQFKRKKDYLLELC